MIDRERRAKIYAVISIEEIVGICPSSVEELAEKRKEDLDKVLEMYGKKYKRELEPKPVRW